MKIDKDDIPPLIAFIVVVIVLGGYSYLRNSASKEEDKQNAIIEQKRLSTYYDSKFCVIECMNDRLKSLFKSDGQFLGGSSTAVLPMGQDKTLEVIKTQCEEFVIGSKCIKQRYMGFELLEVVK